MCSYEKRYGVNPEAPPRPCFFKIICGLLACRFVVALTKHTDDGPRKRYIKEWRIYQQYMDDQEKQEQQKQKKFTDRLREAVSISNTRLRIRRRRYRVKPGDPPPRPPPYCPHWHKARPKPQKAWEKVGAERLRVYEPGQVSRLERYEERLRDPTSREARRRAAREAGYSSTATTLAEGPANPEADLVRMFERLRELERRHAQMARARCEGRARVLREQVGEERRAEVHRGGCSFTTGGTGGGARSLGTIALRGKGSTAKTYEQRGFDCATQSSGFGRA